MSAAHKITVEQLPEAARAAARRLTTREIAAGYTPTALYQYDDVSGSPMYWVIRLDHPNGKKFIRPLCPDSDGQWKLRGPDQRLLYRLPELCNSSETSFIVEGEKCVDALVTLGLTATTSGSSGSADTVDWDVFQGKVAVLWPDNDIPGMSYALEVQDKLKGIAESVVIIDVAALELPEGGDCVDWLALHPAADAAAISALEKCQPEAIELAIQRAKWENPQPLRREPPPPEPFPMAALGEILGGAAAALERIIQAPDAVIGQSILASAALAVQAHADIIIDGRCSPTSLFFLTVAESGERKSATDSVARSPQNKREQFLINQYEADRVSYDADLAAYEKARKAILNNKKMSRADCRAALEDLGPAPQAPIYPMLTSGDPTIEAFLKSLIAGWPSMGLFSGEGGRFLGGYAMNNENCLKTAATLCEIWDGAPVERNRVSDGASKNYGKRASLHLLAQPCVASILLGDATLRDQGFLSRVLIAQPQGKTGFRPYVAEDVYQTAEMRRFIERLAEWLERDLPLAADTRNELSPRKLLLNHEAHADYVAFYEYCEELMRSGNALESVRGLTNKTPEMAARIAAVLNLIEDPEAG